MRVIPVKIASSGMKCRAMNGIDERLLMRSSAGVAGPARARFRSDISGRHERLPGTVWVWDPTY